MATRKKADKPLLWMVKTVQGLKPLSQFDDELLERYPIGAQLIITVEQPKNEKLVRMYNALVSKVAKGIGKSRDGLNFILKLKAGEFDRVVEIGDQMALVPHSVADMDAAHFGAFYERAVEIITTEIVPGADVKELLSETYEYSAIDLEIDP